MSSGWPNQSRCAPSRESPASDSPYRTSFRVQARPPLRSRPSRQVVVVPKDVLRNNCCGGAQAVSNRNRESVRGFGTLWKYAHQCEPIQLGARRNAVNLGANLGTIPGPNPRAGRVAHRSARSERVRVRCRAASYDGERRISIISRRAMTQRGYAAHAYPTMCSHISGVVEGQARRDVYRAAHIGDSQASVGDLGGEIESARGGRYARDGAVS
jgi:hypothetical protein